MKVPENTKRRILPLENHSSKHSRERGGRGGRWEERWENGKRKERGKREREGEEEKEVECEKQRQVLLPPTSSNRPAATHLSTANLVDTV